MGGELARRGVTRLCAEVEVERIVVVGIGGALAAGAAIGALVVPEVVIDAATGVHYRPDRLGEDEPGGTMWTTQELITAPEALATLREAGVVCLEMETAAVAEACVARHRATDASLDDEVFGLINPDGSFRPGAVTTYFLQHPGRVAPMVRFSRDAKRAAECAAAAAVRAVAHLPPPAATPDS
jgi:hypothetical protein